MLIINDTESLLSKISSEITDSNLGYFSKPFRCKHQGRELIIKKYLPVKDLALINAIITNHNEYIRELKATGIKVPDTLIEVQKDKTGYQIIIIQEAFRKDEKPETQILFLFAVLSLTRLSVSYQTGKILPE